MRIGIIGAGRVGTGLGKRLAAHGHDIIVAFATTEARLADAATVIGHGARAGTVEDSARHGDVVILATPWPVTLDLVARLAPSLDGKIVWDTTNPLKPDMSGLEIGTTTSGGEQVALAAPGAHVVKAVSPFSEVLHSPSMDVGGQLPGLFVSGDDEAARKMILGLVAEIPASGVDAGPLSVARYTEPLGMLLVQLAYAEGFGGRIGITLVH